jgi:hypothetical protein
LNIKKERSDEIYLKMMERMRHGENGIKIIPEIADTKEEAAYLGYTLVSFRAGADDEKVYHKDDE